MNKTDLHTCTVCGKVKKGNALEGYVIVEPGVELEEGWYVHIHKVEMGDIDDDDIRFTIKEAYPFCPECAPNESFPAADEAPEDFEIEDEIEALD